MVTCALVVSGALIGSAIGVSNVLYDSAGRVDALGAPLQPQPHTVLVAAMYGAAALGWAGAMAGLIVNAIWMILEEPRPHW